jgi:hypothetical protein
MSCSIPVLREMSLKRRVRAAHGRVDRLKNMFRSLRSYTACKSEQKVNKGRSTNLVEEH